MAFTYILWQFSLAILVSNTEVNGLENFNLKSILQSSSVGEENKLAECLISIVSEFDKEITTNIQICLQAKSANIKEYFVNTAETFLANNNRFAIELGFGKERNYEIHIRMFFIESFALFKNFLSSTFKQEHNFNSRDHFHIILLPKSIRNRWAILKAIFDVWWKLSIVNVNALVEDNNGTVTVYTFFPFNKFNCKDSSPKVINRYTNGSFELKTLNFPIKTRNFWNCPMDAVVWEEPPFSELKHGRVSGLDGLILEQLANILNFSVNVVPSPEGVGYIFDNETVTAGFKMLNDGTADFMIGDIICTQKRQQFFAYCQYNTYYKKIVFRTDVSPNSLTTLLLPFEQSTWFAILAFLITKWFTRPIWKKIANERQKGTYNWCLVVPYLISFLILRSLYEGSLFKILRNKHTQALPNDLDETIEQGYKFMVTQSSYDLGSDIPELQNNMVAFNSPNLLDLFFLQEGKYAFLASQEHMTIFGNGRKYFLAQKPLMSMMTCIFLTKCSYMTNELNNAIEHLRTHGYMDKSRELFLGLYISAKKPKPETQMYFSLAHLMGAFNLFYILISVSSLIFALEILSKRNMRLKLIIEIFE